MKTKKSISSAIIAGALLVGFNQTVAAHVIGNGILGPTASATDYYKVDCTTDPVWRNSTTHHLLVWIQDKSPDSNLVGLSVFSANAGANLKASTTFDPIGGTTGTAAAVSRLTIIGGEGIYNLAVFKTGASIQQYSLYAFCEDVNGVQTNATGLATAYPGVVVSNQ